MVIKFEKWIEVDENLEHRENGTVLASAKRIFITEWLVNAWKEMLVRGFILSSVPRLSLDHEFLKSREESVQFSTVPNL